MPPSEAFAKSLVVHVFHHSLVVKKKRVKKVLDFMLTAMLLNFIDNVCLHAIHIV